MWNLFLSVPTTKYLSESVMERIKFTPAVPPAPVTKILYNQLWLKLRCIFAFLVYLPLDKDLLYINKMISKLEVR